MQTRERRWGQRRPLQGKAWLRKDAGPFQAAQTVDIHQNGAQLWASQPLQKHTLLDLHIKLDQVDPLKLRAMVCWCQAAEEGGYRIGLAFPGQQGSDYTRLRRWSNSRTVA